MQPLVAQKLNILYTIFHITYNCATQQRTKRTWSEGIKKIKSILSEGSRLTANCVTKR